MQLTNNVHELAALDGLPVVVQHERVARLRAAVIEHEFLAADGNGDRISTLRAVCIASRLGRSAKSKPKPRHSLRKQAHPTVSMLDSRSFTDRHTLAR